MISEGSIDFPPDMPDDYKTLIQGLLKHRSERWEDKQIQQWLKGQPLQDVEKTIKGFVTEMFNDNESYSSPKELADLMVKYPDQGVRILYSGIAESWFRKSGRELRAEEIKEVAAAYMKDKQSGYYTAIYKIDPGRAWISKGGKACTNLEEIAKALMSESAYYMEELKKPNAHLYLYLSAVEGAIGTEVSEMFRKYFTEYSPKHALSLVCIKLQDNCITIGSEKYSSPEGLTQEKDGSQIGLIKKEIMETDSLLLVWLSSFYKDDFNIQQSPVSQFLLLSLLPYLSFKELNGINWESAALSALYTFISFYPGRSDFFEAYAAQGLPLSKPFDSTAHNKTPIDFIVSTFNDMSSKHGEDTIFNLIRLLVNLGADVNTVSGDGNFPILSANNAGNDKLIKLLVELGSFDAASALVSPPSKGIVYGNTTGNIVNGGVVVIQDDWMYYSNWSDLDYLYKIRTDGTGKQLIIDDGGFYINIVDDWLYYSNWSFKRKLYKIRIDGTGRQKLNDDDCRYINVAGDWVYYQNDSDEGKPYKIRTDGTCRQKLNDDKCFKINVSGDWVYYSNSSDNNKLYRIRTDGTERQKLNDDACFDINVVVGWVYYCNYNKIDYKKLYKIRTDGTERQKAIDNRCEFINVVSDWVYYRNSNDEGKLYKTRTDGTGVQKLSNDKCNDINVMGDWVYYRIDLGDDYNHYKIKTDGTGRQIFKW